MATPRNFRDSQTLQTFGIVAVTGYLAISFALFKTLDFAGIAKIVDSWWVLQKHGFAHLLQFPAWPWQHELRFGLPLVLAVAAGGRAAAVTWRRLDPDGARHIEGREPVMNTTRAAKILAQEWGKPGPGAIKLGPGLPAMPHDKATEGGMMFGGTGSGKTVVIENLLRTLLSENDAKIAHHKIIIHDVKGDFTSQIAPIIDKNGKIIRPYTLVAPWDTRGTPHEIAADILTLAHARAFAINVIPESKSAPMFSSAARQLLTGFCVYLQSTKPQKWGYADLAALAVTPSEELLPLMDQYHPEARKAVAEANVTTFGILINLIAFFSPIFDLASAQPVAPAPGRGFSMRRWLLTEIVNKPILILQNDATFTPVAKALHSALLATAAQTIASPQMSESKKRSLWFFLDEFPQFPVSAGDSVETIMAVGRSKGSRLWLFSQSVGQLNKTFTADRVKGWLDMIGTMLISRTSGAGAKDFSEIIGNRIVERQQSSTSSAVGGTTATINYQRSPEPVIEQSTLAGLGLVKGKKAVDCLLPLGDRYLLRLRFPFVPRNVYRKPSILAPWTQEPNPYTAAIEAATAPTVAGTGDTDDGNREHEKVAATSTEIVEKTEQQAESETTVTATAATVKLAHELGKEAEGEDIAKFAGVEAVDQFVPGFAEVAHIAEAISHITPAAGKAAPKVQITRAEKLMLRRKRIEIEQEARDQQEQAQEMM